MPVLKSAVIETPMEKYTADIDEVLHRGAKGGDQAVVLRR